ncbi:MAG: hypothetical protein R3C18_11720 [Planctomycetaceae bacterium]
MSQSTANQIATDSLMDSPESVASKLLLITVTICLSYNVATTVSLEYFDYSAGRVLAGLKTEGRKLRVASRKAVEASGRQWTKKDEARASLKETVFYCYWQPIVAIVSLASVIALLYYPNQNHLKLASAYTMFCVTTICLAWTFYRAGFLLFV